MLELVEYLAKSLVDDPDAVRVEEKEKDDVVVIELRVAQPDMGKVIGKQGRIAKAIRTVVKAASPKMCIRDSSQTPEKENLSFALQSSQAPLRCISRVYR